MNRTEGGLFRGAEFSRLVILAAMVAIGWPLVLYYGFWRRAPEPPPKAPAASVPPLPKPDDAKELAGVLDKTKTDFRDQDAFALLLARIRATPAEELAAQARKEVLPIDMLMNPKRYRGLPIRLEGYAETVYVLDDQDPAVTPKKRLYEVWIRTTEHDQRKYPCCLIVEEVPPTLPSGKNLGEYVVFEGYFLKLLAYQAADTARFAPLLIGRIAHVPERTTTVQPSRSPIWTYVILGVLAIYVLVRVTLTIRKNRRGVIPSVRSSDPPDRVATDQLEQWIANPRIEPDEDAED